MKWEPGRQGTGYRKLRLAHGESWDCYLMDYPPGSFIPPHTDPVPGKAHHRFNLVLWGKRGFEPRARMFRPDLELHEVPTITPRRVVFSIGWVR